MTRTTVKREPVVHAFTGLHNRGERTFCGLNADKVKTTRSEREVTCGRCERCMI